MIKIVRREWQALRSLLSNRFPRPGSRVEEALWSLVNLVIHIRLRLRPLSKAQQDQDMQDLLSGSPKP